jgi:hypothetical protein
MDMDFNANKNSQPPSAATTTTTTTSASTVNGANPNTPNTLSKQEQDEIEPPQLNQYASGAPSNVVKQQIGS